jgi:hypothetical protein
MPDDQFPPAEEAQNIELLWPVVPRGDVDGALDWFSGVMALDVDHEVWQQLQDAPPAQREPAVRAYAHELFHWFQFATLGFMHDWAAELFDLLRPVVKRVQSDFAPEDFAGVKRLIRQGPALLSAAEDQALRAHFRQIDAPSRSGLTARAIFESHAYFVERKLTYVMKRSSDWTPHLRTAPAPVYRVAFDALAFLAGYAVAYEWFPAVASVSLCCRRPVGAFERLALALARDPAAKEMKAEPGTAREMISFLQGQLPGTPLFTPIEQLTVTHPVFSGAAQAVSRAVAEGACDVYQLLARPDLQVMKLRERHALEPPIIFRPAPPTKLAVEAPEGYTEGSVLALFALGAVGQRLTQEAANQARAEGQRLVDRLSWIVRDHDLILGDLAVDDLRSGDPGRMLMIFEPKDRAVERPTMWGRLILRMPKELDPSQESPLPLVPEVRRLFRAIHDRLPMFPVYLAPAPSGLYDWFGSIAPEESMSDQGVDISHPAVAKLVEDSQHAIEDYGRSADLNPWLAIQNLFAPLLELPPVES